MFARMLGPVLASTLSIACVTTPSPDEPNERPAGSEPGDEPGEAPGSAPPIVVEVDAPAPVQVDADLPDCPSEPRMPVYCTDAGKLAGAWTMADRIRIPSDAAILFEAERDDTERPSLVVAQLGETLYLRHITCGACARVMGYGFSGRLSAMSEAQILSLQAALGLPTELAALTGLDAWASYCSDENGRAALTEIANRGRAHTAPLVP